jgi:hypothetical protein
MIGPEQAVISAGSELSCKEVELALGSVIVALAGALVAVVKIGWNHLKEQLKDARDHNAALEVTVQSAKQKKGESPR